MVYTTSILCIYYLFIYLTAYYKNEFYKIEKYSLINAKLYLSVTQQHTLRGDSQDFCDSLFSIIPNEKNAYYFEITLFCIGKSHLFRDYVY